MPNQLFTKAHVERDGDNDYVLAKWEGDEPMYRMVMTDPQCQRAAMEDWVGTIAQLWDAIGKQVDEKRLDMYCKQLRIIPFGLLEDGIQYAIRNNTFSTVPPIGVIWEGVHKELDKLNLPPKMDVAEKIERWETSQFKRAAYSFERGQTK